MERGENGSEMNQDHSTVIIQGAVFKYCIYQRTWISWMDHFLNHMPTLRIENENGETTETFYDSQKNDLHSIIEYNVRFNRWIK